jgi:adenylate cyclase
MHCDICHSPRQENCGAHPDSGLGWVHLRVGEFDKSIDYFDKAISMSPYDPGLAFWYAGKMSANFGLKRYDQAIEQARQSIAINPNYIFYTHTALVAALALTDHDAEAREALQRYLALPTTGPKTIAACKAHIESQHWLPALVSERMYDGLRKAGMPEGGAKTN